MMDPKYEKKFWWMCGLTILLLIHSESRANTAWDTMCKVIEKRHGYVCGDITPPRVYLTINDGAGHYDGGNVIYLSAGLKGTELTAIEIHEQVHYLLDALGVIPVPGPLYMMCESERIAWDVSNFYSRSNARQMVMRNWIRKYPECEEK